jgi:sec-independent protein translocase protein TatA
MALLVLITIVLLVFGGRLGDTGKGLGEGIRNFREAMEKEKEKEKKVESKEGDKNSTPSS